jgi:hypothetical protein
MALLCEWRPVVSDFLWSMAWRDHRLDSACTDVQAGLLGATRTVLAETREARQFSRRGYASAVLGKLAAGMDLAEQWLREEPKDPDALLLAARVAAVHAAAAYRRRHRRARALLTQALDLAGRGALAWPDDPTPYVVTLSLARFECQEVESSDRLPELGGLPGPWTLVEQEIWTRDPHNRETGRHLLAYFGSKYEGAAPARVALSVAARSPLASPLRLLPLAAFLEYPLSGKDAEAADLDQYKRINSLRKMVADLDEQLRTGEGIDGYTSSEDVRERRDRLVRAVEKETLAAETAPRVVRPAMTRDLADLHAAWFMHRSGPDEAGVTIADVSLLARGLQLGGEYSRAAAVLRFLLPYASAYPWKLDGDPGEVLSDAIAECSAESHLPLHVRGVTTRSTATRAGPETAPPEPDQK